MVTANKMVKEYILLIYLFLLNFYCNSEKITYISVERPVVNLYDHKLITFFNMTSRRLNRRNPIHYVNLHAITRVDVDNNFTIDYYFYEWLTNEYKPSFIELHYKWCDHLKQDAIFGAPLMKVLKTCPHPPGEYHLYNLTIPPVAIPRGFPFTRGRIYVNVTYGKTKTLVGNGHIDMKVEQLNRKDATSLFP